jgi:hypothetical protein
MVSLGVEVEFPLQDSVIVSRGWGNRVSLIRLQFFSVEGAGFQMLPVMWKTLYSWPGRFLGILHCRYMYT